MHWHHDLYWFSSMKKQSPEWSIVEQYMFWWLGAVVAGLVGMTPCHWVGDATHSRNHLLMLVCLEQRVKSSLAKRWAAEISSALHENLGERMWKKGFSNPCTPIKVHPQPQLRLPWWWFFSLQANARQLPRGAELIELTDLAESRF